VIANVCALLLVLALCARNLLDTWREHRKPKPDRRIGFDARDPSLWG
jgi:hypothetical protein